MKRTRTGVFYYLIECVERYSWFGCAAAQSGTHNPSDRVTQRSTDIRELILSNTTIRDTYRFQYGEQRRVLEIAIDVLTDLICDKVPVFVRVPSLAVSA